MRYVYGRMEYQLPGEPVMLWLGLEAHLCWESVLTSQARAAQHGP
jgi:hypothetical protein